MAEPAQQTVMEQIVSLCKRRGFVYPASEIYGGLNGFWDYGPLGVLLKNNVRDWWWHNLVICPPLGPDGHPVDIVGVDTAIIQNPKVWVASGHVGGFSDPMVDDKETKQRFRADHLFGVVLVNPDEVASAVHGLNNANADRQSFEVDFSIIASTGGEALELLSQDPKPIRTTAEVVGPESAHGEVSLKYRLKKGGEYRIGIIRQVPPYLLKQQPERIPSPFTQKKGTLTEPREFNLMFQTYVGAIQDESAKAYLRPETAQGIFLNYKNVIDTMRVKVPFGVAQVGKSFRNEVTPRNFIFRSREFEQMELEWFCHPDESQKWYEFWKAERMKWWRSLGVKDENLKLRDHEPDELSHYSKMTVDIEYRYPFTAPDFGELEGIAHRGSFDLSAHQQHSGQRLDYFDQELQLQLKAQGVPDEEVKKRSRYVPNVIEPASGLTRAVLVLLCEAFTPDPGRPSGMYMKFHPRFAPIKCGVYPLVNKDGMPERAEKIYLHLRQHFTCEYDAKQAIGKRYARNDEIGTPFCVTVDGQTLQDGTVTVRHRDTMQQERVAEDKLLGYLLERLRV